MVIVLFFAVELPRQVTLAIIKPDAVKAGLVDEIIQKVITTRFIVNLLLHLHSYDYLFHCFTLYDI